MDKKLLDLLACPICKGPLQFQAEPEELICRGDRLAYPVRDGIPIMLVEEGREVTMAELDEGA